jgi:chromosomal replication initiator protein
MALWDRILENVKKRISTQNFETWFKPTSMFNEDLQKGEVSVLVPNRHFQYWLDENYKEVLENSLQELNLGKIKVRYLVAEENLTGTFEKSAVFSGKNGSNGRVIEQLNSKYTFDSFVVGTSNQFAHAAAVAVAERPARAYNPLFIYGGVGLGKTHLMHAIGHQILIQSPAIKVAYMSSEHFMNELIHSIRYDKMIQFRQKYRSIDILLMDDIQFLAGKDRTQEEFFHTFNALYDAQKQIIISSDSPPKEIPTLEERLHSRFEWGLIADIQPPELETKIAILRKKAEVQGVEIPDNVSLFIASNIKSNIRELEGALVRLIAYSSLTGEEISFSLAKRVLRNIAENNAKPITIGAIQKSVAEHYSLRISELKSKNNSRRIAEPRQLAMFLCKDMTGSSLSEIGKEFGGKHHTTVLHAIRKVEKLQKEDPKLKATLERMAASVQ